jgi:hypothetical protein
VTAVLISLCCPCRARRSFAQEFARVGLAGDSRAGTNPSATADKRSLPQRFCAKLGRAVAGGARRRQGEKPAQESGGQAARDRRAGVYPAVLGVVSQASVFIRNPGLSMRRPAADRGGGAGLGRDRTVPAARQALAGNAGYRGDSRATGAVRVGARRARAVESARRAAGRGLGGVASGRPVRSGQSGAATPALGGKSMWFWRKCGSCRGWCGGGNGWGAARRRFRTGWRRARSGRRWRGRWAMVVWISYGRCCWLRRGSTT